MDGALHNQNAVPQPEEWVVAGVGFKGSEFSETIRLWSRSTKLQLSQREYSGVEGFLQDWRAHRLCDLLLLKCDEQSEVTRDILKLQYITQYHFSEHLPLVMIADRPDWVSIAYELGASDILLAPLDRERLKMSCDAALDKSRRRRYELLLYCKNSIPFSFPLREISWIETQPARTTLYLSNLQRAVLPSLTTENLVGLADFTPLTPQRMVNLRWVNQVANEYVILGDFVQTRLSFSPENRPGIIAKFQSFCRHGSAVDLSN